MLFNLARNTKSVVSFGKKRDVGNFSASVITEPKKNSAVNKHNRWLWLIQLIGLLERSGKQKFNIHYNSYCSVVISHDDINYNIITPS